jgi:hypothetical protein
VYLISSPLVMNGGTYQQFKVRDGTLVASPTFPTVRLPAPA